MKARRAEPPEPEPTPAHERRALAVACAVWPDFMELHVDVAKQQLVQIDNVLAGRGALMSRVEREAVEAAALRIPEVTFEEGNVRWAPYETRP